MSESDPGPDAEGDSETETPPPASSGTHRKVVEACPECDRSCVYQRASVPVDIRWRCQYCKSVFAVPVTRVSYSFRDWNSDAQQRPGSTYGDDE